MRLNGLRSLRCAALLCLCLALAQPAWSQGWKKGKPGGWVRPDSIDYNLKIGNAEVDGGYYYSLVDEQANVETKEYYSHYVYKIINDAGVQNASELYFNFNPAFQHLTIHTLKIYRDGRLMDKLGSSAFKSLQRESDLERHIYDNTLSVFTVLADVRAGDVIDYSYTVQGDNPIFENKFHYSFSLSATYTLLKVNERIVRKKSTPLNIRYYKEDRKPAVTQDGPDEVWTWSYTNLPSYGSEDDIPNSYRVSPLVEVSSYFDWKDVIAWAQDVFKKENYKHVAITQKAKSIMEAYPGEKDRIIAALRFVQNQIRYYGLEIGTNAIKPHTPDNTLIKRFGDCKDKAVLFCALLQEMGIDSCYPVLVHASKREQVDRYIPSPTVFNHAIACVTLHNTRYFFDPTSSFEGGDFDHTYMAIYGKGLIVDPACTGIEPVVSKLLSKTFVDEKYDILDTAGKARLTVVTTYYGTHADNERYRFANNSLNDIKKNYLDFYKKRYGELSEEEELFYKDDSIVNKITTTEKYSIECIWDTTEIRDRKRRAYFCSDMIRDFTGGYSRKVELRKLPIGIEHPFEVEHHIEINLPEEWSIDNSTDTFSSPYMTYERRIRYANMRLTLDYSFKTLKPVCEAGDAKAFYTQLDKISDNNWFNVYYSPLPAGSPPDAQQGYFNWVNFFLFLMFLLFVGFGVAYIYHHKSAREPVSFVETGIPNNGKKGIGGWLVLVTIGFCAGPLVFLYAVSTGHFFDGAQWKQLTDPDGSGYSPLWAPAKIIEVLLQVVALGFDMLCLLLMFNYDRRFPRYAIARIISILVFNVILLAFYIALKDRLAEGQLEKASYSLFSSIAAACVWIPYFLVSSRVKNTFTK